MKPSVFTRLSALLMFVVPAFAAADEAPPVIPAVNRLPEKPAWEQDVTGRLVLKSGQSYADVMSREARAGRVRGERLSWTLPVALPADAEAGWPVVLEADEARVLDNTRFGGGELKWDLRDRGDLWFSGEGGVVLPLTAAAPAGTVTFDSIDTPQAYENGFGRLRLRPATLNDVVRLDWNGSADQALALVNRGPLPLDVVLHIRLEDYFGAPLGQTDRAVTLQPGESQPVALPAAVADLYKTRCWVTAGARSTYDHWIVRDGMRIVRERPQVLRLTGDWESVSVPGPFEKNPPPAAGWVKGADYDKLPYTGHWRWNRLRFKVPADWPSGQRVQLLLPPSVDYHARVLINGKPVGEAPGWELPRTFQLPAEVKPGTEHVLCVGVTDYIVGLSPRVTPPAGGPMEPAGRGMASPIGTTNTLKMRFDAEPELFPVPALRVEHAAVRTTLAGGKRIDVRAEVRNDNPFGARVGARFTVLAAGRPVLTWNAPSGVTVSSAQPEVIESGSEWPDAIFWSLENPQLYELRVELTDGGGRVVDTRRERFGFREIGLKDGFFTLNGQVVKLHGGSHVYTTALTWPVRPSPYRLIRAMATQPGPTGGGTSQGVIAMNAADEAGYLLKGAHGANAHGADNYDWQNPVTWARFRAGLESVARAYINHPSIYLWDIGNEISFHGKGEDAMMGNLQRVMREYDPTRLVTVSGSYPFPSPSEILNYHGWGSWQNRSDYFFMRPEERPSYLRDTGYFIRKPDGDTSDKWKADLHAVGGARRLYPGVADELIHVDNKPLLFAESMYFETVENFPIFGHDTYLMLPQAPDAQPWAIESSARMLNMQSARTRALQNVRQAGMASMMIHVSGGTGRYLLPVASFPWDRDLRFESGFRLRARFGVHYDLTAADTVTARYRLLDGEALLGEKTETLAMQPGTIAKVDLDFPLPAVKTDRTLRIEVRVWPASGGEYYDSADVTVFAPVTPKLPAGVKLAVFDPRNSVAGFLDGAKVPFTRLEKITDWSVAGGDVLLIGSEGLAGADNGALAALAKSVAAGGRVIVLDHFSLPKFLPRNFVQGGEALSYAARLDGPSVVTKGLLTEDFRTWITREHDQVVSWNALETPVTGHFRAHLNAGRAAPVLEIGEGRGRVLFAQLNFKDALGVEPVATRVMANLLDWTASPSPFRDTPVLVVASDKKFARGLESRVGLAATVSAEPSSADLGNAGLIIVQGTDAAALNALTRSASALRKRLDGGATLIVYGLSPDGANWLGQLSGSTVKLDSFPHRFAYVVNPADPLMAGLGHGDFFSGGLNKGFRLGTALDSADDATGEFTVAGSKVRPLTRPAYLATIPVGRGRILVDLVRSIEKPVPSQVRVLSMLLGNAGAKLDPDGVGAVAKVAWKFQPLDLAPFVNWSLRDSNDPKGKRGGNMSGEGDDFREFPVGAQNLRGVDYLITPPEKAAGNSVILIAGKNAKLGGAGEVKGIPVNAKAERLFFAHTSLWGTPGFIYRVYYKDDRAVWIPGKPDPFVDVVVKANENISEWVFAGEFDRQDKFISGATVAWVGGNARTRGAAGGDKALGLYQMTWDNPHPEKTIESIDILSPQTDGAGNALVFAITAAVRDTGAPAGEPAKPAPALKSVLPAGVSPASVQTQVHFPRYGFVLLKDGTIPAIYDEEGRVFAGGAGFKATARPEAPGAKGAPQDLSVQAGQKPTITETKTDAQRVFTIKGGDAALDWTATVTATPARLRYDFSYTPKVSADAGWVARLQTGLSFVGPAQTSVKVNENPIPVELPGGLAQFAFDREYTRWVFDYEVWGGNWVIKSPRKDLPPFAPGRTESFWWELTPP